MTCLWSLSAIKFIYSKNRPFLSCERLSDVERRRLAKIITDVATVCRR